jgi:hypothetical protein
VRVLLLTALLVLAPLRALASRVTVPVDVGVGPAAYFITGPLQDDQLVHLGLELDVEAVIDREWVRENPNAIPRRYRKMAKDITEVRISPSIFIPDALFISPKLRNTGMFGATWRPLALAQPIGSGAVRLRLGAGLLLTYAFIYSDLATLPTTHFLRPGADLMAEVELKVTDSFLVSFGWASGFYIPQKLGSLGFGALEESIWHVGQGFLQLHFRFPYTTNI